MDEMSKVFYICCSLSLVVKIFKSESVNSSDCCVCLGMCHSCFEKSSLRITKCIISEVINSKASSDSDKDEIVWYMKSDIHDIVGNCNLKMH